jgi:hypothetical protein
LRGMIKFDGSGRGVGAVLALAGAALALLVWAGGSAAAPDGLDGTFKVHFPKGHPASNAPCPEDAFCGVGRLVGYGQATITIVDEAFDEIPDSPCLSVTWTQAIDPVSGVGELVLDEAGRFCPPGRSADSHAGPSSYGHPGRARLSYTIDGSASSGTFNGAEGTGEVRFKSAGGVGVWTVRGDLSLAG